MFQNHLNVITQCFLQDYGAQSVEIAALGTHHDISSILAQHATEEGATVQESPTSDEQHIFGTARTEDAHTEEKIVTPAAAVDHDANQLRKGAGNHSGKVKATLGRMFKWGAQKRYNAASRQVESREGRLFTEVDEGISGLM